jgi:uncharacterized membrane protein YhhN
LSTPAVLNPLTALRALWFVLLAGGLAWGAFVGHATFPAITGRLGSSLVLVLAGLYAAWRKPHNPLIRRVAIGIAFGALGDFCNAGLLVPRELSTLAAMGAFGIGHLFYIAGLISVLQARESSLASEWWRSRVVQMALASWWAVGALGWWLIVASTTDDTLTALIWPALGYTLLLSATAGLGLAAATEDSSLRLLAVGAALFLVSDLILAVEIFRGPFPQDTLAVWILYGVGQMMIVFCAAQHSSEVDKS